MVKLDLFFETRNNSRGSKLMNWKHYLFHYGKYINHNVIKCTVRMYCCLLPFHFYKRIINTIHDIRGHP